MCFAINQQTLNFAGPRNLLSSLFAGKTNILGDYFQRNFAIMSHKRPRLLLINKRKLRMRFPLLQKSNFSVKQKLVELKMGSGR